MAGSGAALSANGVNYSPSPAGGGRRRSQPSCNTRNGSLPSNGSGSGCAPTDNAANGMPNAVTSNGTNGVNTSGPPAPTTTQVEDPAAKKTYSKSAPKLGSCCWLADRVTCRFVLNFMVLLGFMFNYMLRVNLTIAIVEMVVKVNKTLALNSTLFNETGDSLHLIDSNASIAGGGTADGGPGGEGRFEWDEYLQNIVLGCFYWGYICTELPGGRLAEVFGGRRVFGYSMLVASVVTLLTPVAANVSVIAVIVLRVVLGFMLGATWPAIHPMTAQWIPPMERSKFIANMMASSLGAAITMPICGLLIASLGWESVFYATGVVGLLWSVAWFLLIFDSPADHPRISYEERRYIETAIGTGTSKKHLAVPWKTILSSGPVWAIIITHGASVFGYFTVANQLPTYMKHILHFDIKQNGLLSSLPYLGKYIFAVITSHLADYLRKSGKLSTTATRKTFTSFALAVPCVLMVAQMFMGDDATAAVTFLTIALTVNGAVTAGYLGNGLDIAPNFSGTIFGMANTLSSAGGFLSAFMVGSLTQNNQTYGQWRIVFGIIAATYGVGVLVYVLLGSGELQPWNAGAGAVAATDDDDEEEKAPANGANGTQNGGPLPETIPLRKDSGR